MTTLSLFMSEEVLNSSKIISIIIKGGVLDLMFLIRTQWIPDLVNELVENFSFVRKLGNLGVLVKLLFMTTLLAHFFGSAFHYTWCYLAFNIFSKYLLTSYISLQSYENGATDTWLEAKNI